MYMYLHVDLEDVERGDGEVGGAGRQHPAAGAQRVVLRREQPHPSGATSPAPPRRLRPRRSAASARPHFCGGFARDETNRTGRAGGEEEAKQGMGFSFPAQVGVGVPVSLETGPEAGHVVRPRAVLPFAV